MLNMKEIKKKYFERTDSWPKIILIYTVLILIAFLTTYPLLNVLSVSLRPGDQLFSMTLKLIPDNWTLENYRIALFEKDLLIWLKNSLIISLVTAAFGVVLSISAAYSFSRFRFWGRKSGMMIFLVTQMFPAPMLLLPMYILLVKLGLINQFLGLLIPYIATAVPFSVWNLKGYFDTVPKSLEESAYIDGCNVVQALIKIVLPLSTPAIAISFLFSFMTAWSEYIVARIILTNKKLLTLPVGLVNMQGQFATSWGIYSAAAIITSIPVIILFVSLSRYLVGGLTVGGVKE
ncbi:carbohydrate ABC transporter membrane protein 2 (CUT1 family) [Hypnocyclicus thermotrophus]|uniref:Carbohydrate ABC transporter membrane protein 2 (CUT1 family) n=1 Tax=Hypnocyclicus thermotrophus TaxID=1627895 RepID=A0AA46E013_9FUSO|nr:sugar ABC transporter permease [Hypnocyclicus thermotrophus]TDT72277.1 carbohydrate ABC transporter membrane protein 2 (CUT1 family) [Hypnocyclicus thermotrophus]